MTDLCSVSEGKTLRPSSRTVPAGGVGAIRPDLALQPSPLLSPTAAVGVGRRAKPARCQRRRPCPYLRGWLGGAGFPRSAAVPLGRRRSDGGVACRVAQVRVTRWRCRGCLAAGWCCGWWRRPHGPGPGPFGAHLGLGGPSLMVVPPPAAVGGVSGAGDGLYGGAPTAARRRELHEPAGSAGPDGPGLLLLLRPVGYRHWRWRLCPPACPRSVAPLS
jgi:hypothetical protein